MTEPMDIALLRTELERDEGRRAKPYTDTVGKVTIGIGRNLTDRGLSDDEIDYLLEKDIGVAIDELDRVAPWWMDQTANRQRALVNLMFNIGAPTFLQFRRFIAAMLMGNYDRAADELLDSRWADQVGPRAHRIADLIRKG